MKPPEYRHSCTISRELPYNVVQNFAKGSQPGIGVLRVGRVVWLDGDLKDGAHKPSVRAYAEGIGLIDVDPTALSAVC